MKSGNAIEVRDVTKKFKVYPDKGHTLKEKTLFQKRRKYEERYVLNGISFDVKKGEAVGLIGHNGCGKSTTLKLLTKIMYPDSGTIKTSGRVSSLLELGAGFHPDMSGRENIYINASVFGLTKKEIDGHVQDMIAFSELEEFIDNPVRTYSSGMYMRLAFAVAIHVRADILLIDEILAVGDANFQAKCFEKMREIKEQGITIVIVSHSLGQIEQMCDRSIWIDKGRIRGDGKPRDIHPVYLDYMGQKRRIGTEKKASDGCIKNRKDQENSNDEKKELGGFEVRIIKSELLNEKGIKTGIYDIGSSMTLRIEYERRDDRLKEAVLGFHIFRADGTDCYGSNTFLDKVPKIRLQKNGVVMVKFKHILLLQGKYKIDLAFQDETGLNFHYLYDAVTFDVLNQYGEIGVSRIEHDWITEIVNIQKECGKGEK